MKIPPSNFVKELAMKRKGIILVTGHRRESFGQGFNDICFALKQIASLNPHLSLIYPVHLNPNVQQPVNQILKNIPNIHLVAPLDYPDFIYLFQRAIFVISDSGGVQEEACALSKDVLLMRDVTERPEAVKSGFVKLVGTSTLKIVKEASVLIQGKNTGSKHKLNPYGRGNAGEKIVEILERCI